FASLLELLGGHMVEDQPVVAAFPHAAGDAAADEEAVVAGVDRLVEMIGDVGVEEIKAGAGVDAPAALALNEDRRELFLADAHRAREFYGELHARLSGCDVGVGNVCG